MPLLVRLASLLPVLLVCTRLFLMGVPMDHSPPLLRYDSQVERYGPLQFGSTSEGTATARFTGRYVISARVPDGGDNSTATYQFLNGATFHGEVVKGYREPVTFARQYGSDVTVEGVDSKEDEIILWGGRLEAGDSVRFRVTPRWKGPQPPPLRATLVFDYYQPYTVFIKEGVFCLILLAAFGSLAALAWRRRPAAAGVQGAVPSPPTAVG